MFGCWVYYVVLVKAETRDRDRDRDEDKGEDNDNDKRVSARYVTERGGWFGLGFLDAGLTQALKSQAFLYHRQAPEQRPEQRPDQRLNSALAG
ncbi:hypothetical protein RRF57_012019 [Xylaria bambusicola]|uniref:Uncharacterized protein n=1 Tax=Xylaria bambusicola TaxID=326684 RepID=A0AAN7ZAD7_9PEZI